MKPTRGSNAALRELMATFGVSPKTTELAIDFNARSLDEASPEEMRRHSENAHSRIGKSVR